MAGNVGTQSLAVTIRVLMDESLTGKQKVELVFKEMRIAFSNGAILGIFRIIFQFFDTVINQLMTVYIWI